MTEDNIFSVQLVIFSFVTKTTICCKKKHAQSSSRLMELFPQGRGK